MSHSSQWRLVRPSELTDEVVEMFAKENEGKASGGFKHITEFIPEVLEQLAEGDSE
jgi:hypothetical protein